MKKSYSQLGQDLWVLDVFKYKKCGFFLEIGALDGITHSNCYSLEKDYEWTGICIEANPYVFEKLQKNRPNSTCVNTLVDKVTGDTKEFHCADSLSFSKNDNRNMNDDKLKQMLHLNGIEYKKIVLKTKTIYDILVENKSPPIIDYLSIDIEGMEYDILSNFPFDTYRVNTITVEHNAPHIGTEYQMKLRILLEKNGFIFIKGNDDIHKWGHGSIDDFYVYSLYRPIPEMNLRPEPESVSASTSTTSLVNKPTFKSIISKSTLTNLATTNSTLIKSPKKIIGILINKSGSLFENGCFQQSYFLYELLNYIPWIECRFLSGEASYVNFEYFNDKVYHITANSNFSEYDILICLSGNIKEYEVVKHIKNCGVKIVNYVCGNWYTIYNEDIIFGKHNRISNTSISSPLADELWVIPNYESQLEFLTTITGVPAKIIPYVWDGKIIDKLAVLKNMKIADSDYDSGIEIKTGQINSKYCIPYNPLLNQMTQPKPIVYIIIMEANMNVTKTCLIPLLICEKLYKEGTIDLHVLCMCDPHTQSFTEFLKTLTMYKDNRVEKYNRLISLEILRQLSEKEGMKIILSHQKDNPLNFLHVEMMYIGYPLVHNSEPLKDGGYYYEGEKISSAVEKIKQAVREHNIPEKLEEYRRKCNEVIERYSPAGVENIKTHSDYISKLIGDSSLQK
jgi:FkbM family methyltransferase